VHRQEIYDKIQRGEESGLDKQTRFKKLHGIEDCTCKIMDFDWPNPTLMGKSGECPVHLVSLIQRGFDQVNDDMRQKLEQEAIHHSEKKNEE